MIHPKHKYVSVVSDILKPWQNKNETICVAQYFLPRMLFSLSNLQHQHGLPIPPNVLSLQLELHIIAK